MTAGQELAPIPEDEVTRALRALRDELAVRFAGVAAVTGESADDRGAVEGCTVEPTAPGAVDVWWMHSAEEVTVGLAGAPGWELDRSADAVPVVRAVVDAAARGEVEIGRGRGVTTYRVRTTDGVVREDTHEGLGGLLLSMPWKPRLRWTTAAAYA